MSSSIPPDMAHLPLSIKIDPSSPDLPELVVNQLFELMTVQGLMPVPLKVVDSYYFSQISLSAFFGIRIGSSAIMGILLFLISKNRRTPAFIFNQICLLLLFIQSSLYLGYLHSSYSATSTYLTGAYDVVSQNTKNLSAVTSVFQTLLVVFIHISLIIQVRAVFPPFSVSRKAATAVMGFFSICCITLTFLVTIERCVSAMDPTRRLYGDTRFGLVLPSMSQISLAVSIFVCCLVLVGKLLFAIRTRHILGLKQFGPLQILVIMGTQSMIIPVVLNIINLFFQYGGEFDSSERHVTGLASLSPLVIVLSLPMSAMWASSKNTFSTNQELRFVNRSSGHGDTCSACQSSRRPGYGGRSLNSSAASAYDTAASYFSSRFEERPVGFKARMGRVRLFFEYCLFRCITYKTARDKKKLESEIADMEKRQNQDKYEATTSLSIQTIERNPRYEGKQNQHKQNYDNGDGKPCDGVNASGCQYDFNDDQYSPKSATTLYSPQNSSSKHYFDNATVEDVFYSSSSSSAGLNEKKNATVTSISRIDSTNSEYNNYFSRTGPNSGRGIIITKNELPLPSSSSSSKDNISPIREQQYQENQYGQEKQEDGIDNSDLLSLDENENEEEYYNRMKSKYEGSKR